MLCIYLKNTDPFFCLAAEEYFLKNFSDDIFMLWQSNDTVVVGKHQNALAEINYRFVRDNNITVARRISGGGTVFHDSGNVNFSFIKNVKSPSEISFKQFTAPVVGALAKLGIAATTSGRNDLLINGLKISGNAEHVYKNRVLHHGTLLFSSNLDNLGLAIKVVPGKYESKAVQSNRSPVANISQFLKTQMTTAQFIQFLISVQTENPGNSIYSLSENDTLKIEMLKSEKFSAWEWNFGYSPRYSFSNKAVMDENVLKTELQVEKGIITAAMVSGQFFSEMECRTLQNSLRGKKHFYEDVRTELEKIKPAVSDELIYVFF
jgi:lipoate-protein ligase A